MYERYLDAASGQTRSEVAIRPRARSKKARNAAKFSYYFPENPEVVLGAFRERELYHKKRYQKHRPETPNILTEKQVRRLRNRILKIYQPMSSRPRRRRKTDGSLRPHISTQKVKDDSAAPYR